MGAVASALLILLQYGGSVLASPQEVGEIGPEDLADKPARADDERVYSPYAGYAAFFDIDRPDIAPATVQDRAYTSPIWYTP